MGKRLEAAYRELLALDLFHHYSTAFDDSSRHRQMIGPAPKAGPQKLCKAPAGLPAYIAQLYRVPLLTREQEQHLFRKLNYLKFLISRILSTTNPEHLDRRNIAKAKRYWEIAAKTRAMIVEANLRLVVSESRHWTKWGHDLFELISEGNMALLRAVDRFDVGRGFKFSTYATWAVSNNIKRSCAKAHIREWPSDLVDFKTTEGTSNLSDTILDSHNKSAVAIVLGSLVERERDIITLRYGLGATASGIPAEPLTLKEVGKIIGVTKERVRQLQSRAELRLREVADQNRLELAS